MQGSVCVNQRCGYRQKGEHRSCPRCGWLMLDGPLPEAGSIAPPKRELDVKAIGAGLGAAAVLFLAAIGMVAGSFTSVDPVKAAEAHVASAETLPASSPDAVAPVATPAPIATPAAVAAAAPASVAKKTVAKAPAKKTTVAKKAPAKKSTKKPSTKVARR